MESISPHSLPLLNDPEAKARAARPPEAEPTEQAEQRTPALNRETVLVDLSRLSIHQLMAVNEGILAPSIQRISDKSGEDAVAGFSQGLA